MVYVLGSSVGCDIIHTAFCSVLIAAFRFFAIKFRYQNDWLPWNSIVVSLGKRFVAKDVACNTGGFRGIYRNSGAAIPPVLQTTKDQMRALLYGGRLDVLVLLSILRGRGGESSKGAVETMFNRD